MLNFGDAAADGGGGGKIHSSTRSGLLDCFRGLGLQVAGPMRTACSSICGSSGCGRCCCFPFGGVRRLSSGVSDLLSLGLVGLSPTLGGKGRGRRLGSGEPLLSIDTSDNFPPISALSPSLSSLLPADFIARSARACHVKFLCVDPLLPL